MQDQHFPKLTIDSSESKEALIWIYIENENHSILREKSSLKSIKFQIESKKKNVDLIFYSNKSIIFGQPRKSAWENQKHKMLLNNIEDDSYSQRERLQYDNFKKLYFVEFCKNEIKLQTNMIEIKILILSECYTISK